MHAYLDEHTRRMLSADPNREISDEELAERRKAFPACTKKSMLEFEAEVREAWAHLLGGGFINRSAEYRDPFTG